MSVIFNHREKQKRIRIALKEEKADLVFKNARIINVLSGEIHSGDIAVAGGYIAATGKGYEGKQEIDLKGKYVSAGFIDAHCHTESSMVTADRLAAEAIVFGTTALITDPHEIANVAGSEGIAYILQRARHTPADIYVMLPSCVPSSDFETGGAELEAPELEKFRNNPAVLGLGEVMDLEGIYRGKKELLDKIALFEEEKTVDGHGPLVGGVHLQACRAAGIQTDHESVGFEEALEKLRSGISVLVREGTSERNLHAIISGVVKNGTPTWNMAFCTDDKTIHSIRREGHISCNIRMAVELGMDPVQAYAMATVNAARIYGLKNTGAVAPGFRADLVLLNDMEKVEVDSVYKKGVLICGRGEKPHLQPADVPAALTGTVRTGKITADALRLPAVNPAPVIELQKNQILTKKRMEQVPLENGFFRADRVYSKCLVIERHHGTGNMGKGIVMGYGIRKGAVASTIAHDCHNLIVIGDNDADMLLAIEELQRVQGGCTVVGGGRILKTIELPIAGILTGDLSLNIDEAVGQFIAAARSLGVPEGIDPQGHLSFIALPVIPEIRITDKGLFDVAEKKFL